MKNLGMFFSCRKAGGFFNCGLAAILCYKSRFARALRRSAVSLIKIMEV